jgi:hypothetical protein
MVFYNLCILESLFPGMLPVASSKEDCINNNTSTEPSLTLQYHKAYNSYSLLRARGYFNIKNGKCNLSLKV